MRDFPFSFPLRYTSSFLTRSVQFIFSILLQYHISKLCGYFIVAIKTQYLRYSMTVKTVPLHAKQTQSEYISTSPAIDTGAKPRWVASATPGEVKRYPQEARCAPVPVRTGTEYLALTVRRTADRPVRSELLYRLSYRGRRNATQ